MKNLLVLILFFSFFPSVAQSDPVNFVGFSKKQLYQKLGRPSATRKNGAKGLILIYETPEVTLYRSQPFGSSEPVRRILQEGEKKTFYLNKKGKVYAWKAR